MRGAARAIAWELHRRHRLALVLLGVYLAGFWIVKAFFLGPAFPIRMSPSPNGMAGWLIGPLTVTFFFFVGMYSYGLGGDLGARESPFPRRMFTLPVRTVALAGWPMLYGTLASAGLWIGTAALARLTDAIDIRLPWIWPALLAATFLAWMQALTWLAYPLRGLRIVVAVLLLTSVDAVVILATLFGAGEATLVAILAPQLALAYVVGYYAVARARRGVLPDWQGVFDRRSPGRPVRSPAQFSSPMRAQAWLEWRRHGITLPVLVGLVVPCLVLLLFVPGHDTPAIVYAIVALALLVPPAMALLAAPALSSFGTHAATRPLTSAALVAAKLRMTIRSTLTAWAIALAFIGVALFFSGAMRVVLQEWERLVQLAGVTRAAILTALVIAALVAATWKNLVLSLAIGLSGRPAVVRASVLLAMILICAAFPVAWILLRNERVQSVFWDWFPCILVALVWVKVCAGAWVAVRLHDRKVFGDRALVLGAVAWLATVAAVYAVFAWIAASPIFPFYFLGGLAILAVPLVRLAAAPLALAGSRHR